MDSFHSSFSKKDLPGTFIVQYGRISKDDKTITWYECLPSRLEWRNESFLDGNIPSIVAIPLYRTIGKNKIHIVEKVECTGYIKDGKYEGVYTRFHPNSDNNWIRPVFRVWKTNKYQFPEK